MTSKIKLIKHTIFAFALTMFVGCEKNEEFNETVSIDNTTATQERALHEDRSGNYYFDERSEAIDLLNWHKSGWDRNKTYLSTVISNNSGYDLNLNRNNSNYASRVLHLVKTPSKSIPSGKHTFTMINETSENNGLDYEITYNFKGDSSKILHYKVKIDTVNDEHQIELINPRTGQPSNLFISSQNATALILDDTTTITASIVKNENWYHIEITIQ